MSFTPHPVIEFDPDAKSFYLRLGAHDVERTQEIADGLNVDFDCYGGVVGVEVLL